MGQDIKEVAQTILDIEFAGIDCWSRPGYKVQTMNVYLGSTDTLFPNKDIAPNGAKEEIDAYFRENIDELVIFGDSFDDDQDPLGNKVGTKFKLNIV